METFANSHLGKLPPELRNRIYEYAFDTVISVTPSYPGEGRTPICHERCCRQSVRDPHAISLTATCKALRAESLGLFYRNVTINLCIANMVISQSWRITLFLDRLDRNPIVLPCLAKIVIEAGRFVFLLDFCRRTIEVIIAILREGRLPAIETMLVWATLLYGNDREKVIKHAELEIDVVDLPRSARKAVKQLEEIDEQEMAAPSQSYIVGRNRILNSIRHLKRLEG
ncbi:hypothetical protein EJ03DRAFT_338058 [Teratosphaeria nubilosa]|uniref:F-box domain-containing protein n=1 Tax=Teratosphaeria nubilosa TaxID=161662 RepID=A0A6G1L2Y6_9PEZI|nr:hypothetical protein EJ03DRAFT_338058 [Teratosphaeria nubilosa]